MEYSLESGFVKGMKLEVPNKCNIGTYWVTSVIMTCGPLLRLRFDGYEEDSSADFWCDLISSEIHPIGWCAQNNQVLQPPEGEAELLPYVYRVLSRRHFLESFPLEFSRVSSLLKINIYLYSILRVASLRFQH